MHLPVIFRYVVKQRHTQLINCTLLILKSFLPLFHQNHSFYFLKLRFLRKLCFIENDVELANYLQSSWSFSRFLKIISVLRRPTKWISNTVLQMIFGWGMKSEVGVSGSNTIMLSSMRCYCHC